MLSVQTDAKQTDDKRAATAEALSPDQIKERQAGKDTGSKKKPFLEWWKTLPGLITAVTALVVAIGGLIGGLHTAGLIGARTPTPDATAAAIVTPEATATALINPTPIHTPTSTLVPTATPTLTPEPSPTSTNAPTLTPVALTSTPAPTHTPTPTSTPTPGLVERRAVEYDDTKPGEGDANHHEWVPYTTDPVLGCPGEDTFAIRAISLTPPPLKGSVDAHNEPKGPAVIYKFDLLPATRYYLYVRGFAESGDHDAVFVGWKPAPEDDIRWLLDAEKGLKFSILEPPKLNWQPGQDLIEVEVETEGKYPFYFRMRKVGLVLKTIVLSPRKCDFDRYPCNVEKACGVSD